MKKNKSINTISGRAAVDIPGSFFFLPLENFDILKNYIIVQICFSLSLSF